MTDGVRGRIGAAEHIGELAPAATPRLHGTVLDDQVIRERLADTIRPALDATGVPLIGEPQLATRARVPLRLHAANHPPRRHREGR
ncbi:hypothetical protein [Micromonospora sp. 067-2]|uniref:hypothetical protein n=1 Tax=Micromonospora sp. 067-2 TaxID=2789270 RepID=UPI003979BD5E